MSQQVPQEDWDELVIAQEEVNPFLKWNFLHILEASGSAVSLTDWYDSVSILKQECMHVTRSFCHVNDERYVRRSAWVSSNFVLS